MKSDPWKEAAFLFCPAGAGHTTKTKKVFTFQLIYMTTSGCLSLLP